MVAFHGLRVLLYVVVLCLYRFCFLIFPPEPLTGDDVLCRLLSRPLPSVCFLPSLFVLFCFSPTVFVPGFTEFYLPTFPRFPLRKKEHKSYFGKNRTHDFLTIRCADYLLDHSGCYGVTSVLLRFHFWAINPSRCFLCLPISQFFYFI